MYRNNFRSEITDTVAVSGKEPGAVIADSSGQARAKRGKAALAAACLWAAVVFTALCLSGCGSSANGTSVTPVTESAAQEESVTAQTERTEQTAPDESAPAGEAQDDKAAIAPDIQRNVNVYLSNFSEVRMPSFVGHPDVETMVDFAYQHNFFNNPKSIESGDYDDPFNLVTDDVKPGEYYGQTYYNHRISYDVIRSTTKKYFNYDLSEKEIKNSGVSDYTDGYYYTQETGGNEPYGFVVAESVEPLGANEYRVKFHIYNLYKTYAALGLSFTDDVDIYKFSENDLKDLRYTDDFDPTPQSIRDAEGEAIITASDLSDRKQFGIKEYNVVYY